MLSFTFVPSRHATRVETTDRFPTQEPWYTCVKPCRWERCARRTPGDCGWKDALRTGTIRCLPSDV